MKLKAKTLLLFLSLVLFGLGFLFLGNKSVQAAASDPVNVNVYLHDSTGNPITNGNVSLVLGPVDPATSCSYAGKSSTWTGTYGLAGVYIFNNGANQLQVCGNLQSYVINATAAGFLSTSVDAYSQIHGNGGSTVIIDVQLSQPSGGAITQVSVRGSVSGGTAVVNNNGAFPAGTNKAVLVVGLIANIRAADNSIAFANYSINGGAPQGLTSYESHSSGACGGPLIFPCGLRVAYYYKALGDLAPNTSITVRVDSRFSLVAAIYANVNQSTPFVSQTSPSATNYVYSLLGGIQPVSPNLPAGSVLVNIGGAVPNDNQTITSIQPGIGFDFSSVPGFANSLNFATATGFQVGREVGCLGKKTIVEPGGHIVPGWLAGCPGVHLAEALNPSVNTTLSVSVFEDTNGNGLWGDGETAVQKSKLSGLIVRRTSAVGPLLTSDSATYYDYNDIDLPPGEYTLYINPAVADLTKYSYRQIGVNGFSVRSYKPDAFPYSRTDKFNIVKNQTTKVNLGVQTLFPDYGVDSVTANEPLVVGANISFKAVVRNKGTADAPMDGSGRFCIDVSPISPPDKCYGVSNPSPGTVGNNPDLPVITVGNTRVVNSTGDTWLATLGPHTITFCADIQFKDKPNGYIRELIEGSLDNCKTQNIVVAPGLPWVKTEKGNVGSLGNIDLGAWAPGGEHNADYIVSHANSIVGVFTSAKNWVLAGYTPQGKLSSKNGNNYTGFYNEFAGASACIFTNDKKIPNQRGKFRFDGTLKLEGYSAPGPVCGSGKDAAVIFVEGGDLEIRENLNFVRPTVFIVSGSITIKDDVTTVNATLINDKGFADGTEGSGDDELLTVNGSIIAGLVPAPADRLLLQRSVPDPYLSEHIILQPEDYYYLTDLVGVAMTHYKEENP